MVAFDAVNPGTWVMHCHNLYHMAAGMMTTLTYVGQGNAPTSSCGYKQVSIRPILWPAYSPTIDI